MASKMASDDFDDQFLTCPVCMLHFRDPRVLPCLHTFCKECVQEWATKQQPLECPTCRTEVSLPDQGVDGLKSNFYVNNLLDFAAAKKGAEPDVPCQVCEGGQGGVKSWCTDCSVLLCESCAKGHRKIPGTKNHEVVPQEAIKKGRGIEGFQGRKYCSKHGDQKLAFYCESCTTLICTACTVIDHRPGQDHKTVEISSVAQSKKQSLQSLTQQLNPRLKDVSEAIEKIDKEREKLPVSRKEAIDQAATYFRHLGDLVKKKEEEILTQINTTCQKIDKTLESHRAAVEFDAAGLTSAVEFCERAVEHGSDVHIVEVEGQVQKRVKDLLAKRPDMTPRLGEVNFVQNTNISQFETQLDKGVRVEAKSVADVAKCTVVVKPAVVGFVNGCLLNTKDENGQPCDVSRGDITATLNDPSGKAVHTRQQQMEGGLWKISYTPHVSGKYRLEVKVNSQHVVGSPFDVNVQRGDTPVLTIGRQGSGVGELNGPVGVAVDKDGNIAVVEQGNKRVQIFDANEGHSLKCFPVEGQYPYDIDVDCSGRFLVTSYVENYGVRCYSQEGKLLDTFKPNCMKDPVGVTVLKDGRMVVADCTQKSCHLLQHDGSHIRVIGKGHLQDPRFIAVDESRGLFFVTNFDDHKVFVFDLDGNLKFSFGEQGGGEGEFQRPSGITLDPASNIIVVQWDGGRLQVFGPDGTFKRTVARVKGGNPCGITLTPDGYIAVACFRGHCIEMYRYH